MYHTMHLKQQLKLSTVQDTLYQKKQRGGGGVLQFISKNLGKQ